MSLTATDRAIRIGSLCTGYGGLDLGLALGLGVEVRHAWHVENDPAPSKILAARFPGIPNHGDLTTLDHDTLEPVDWLTAGFPCQPASSSGKRKGMADDRWIWEHITRALANLRPRHVLLENVTGLLTVDRGRAFERVICDLAALGYLGRWGTVRASDTGSPQRRARVFIRAAAADTQRQPRHLRPGLRPSIPAGIRRGRPDHRPLQAPPDPDRPGLQGHRSPLRAAPEEPSDHGPVPDRDSIGRTLLRREQPLRRDLDRRDSQDTVWGHYEPAVRRWEHLTGRPAPRPVLDTRAGTRHLNPRFVEWMHGLDDGWVTDVDGLDREDQLRALGNGVVPRQAALAVRLLAPRSCEAVA